MFSLFARKVTLSRLTGAMQLMLHALDSAGIGELENLIFTVDSSCFMRGDHFSFLFGFLFVFVLIQLALGKI